MKLRKTAALFAVLTMLSALTGCSMRTAENAAGNMWSAVQNKFDDLMGFSQIKAELDTIKTGTAAGIKPAGQQKGTVDLSEGTESGSDESSESDETPVPEVPQSGGGESGGGFLSRLFGGFSRGNASGLPDYSFYCEYYNNFKDDMYGYSPYIVKKVWYKDNKMKVTTELIGDTQQYLEKNMGAPHVEPGTVYYTVESKDGYKKIMNMSTPDIAKSVTASGSGFAKTGSETVNGLDCDIYTGDCSELLDTSGYVAAFWVYDYNGSPVITGYMIGVKDVTAYVGSGAGGEYRYTFGGVEDTDVTPPDGTTAADLG